MSSATFVQHLFLPRPLWHFVVHCSPRALHGQWLDIAQSVVRLQMLLNGSESYASSIVIKSLNPSVVTSICTISDVYCSLYTNWFHEKVLSTLPCLVHTLYLLVFDYSCQEFFYYHDRDVAQQLLRCIYLNGTYVTCF
jgi:hypothetical protein